MTPSEPSLSESPSSWNRGTLLGAAALAVVVLFAGLLTVPRYGITSDEPVAWYGAQWQLWAMGTDHPNRWKLKEPPPPEFARTTEFNTHPDPTALRLPAFPALFGAAFAPVFRLLPGYQELDAHHAGLILLHALVVLAMALYLARLLGRRQALLIAGLYALYPTVFGHAHYNVKDLPMAGLYALAVLSFAAGVVENRARFLLQSGFWLGLSFSSKANALFAVPTLLAWLPIAAWLFYRAGRLPTRKAVAAACLLPWVAGITFWASWPYARAGGLGEQWEKIADMMAVMTRFAATGRDSFAAYPFLTVAVMTPPVLLFGLLLAAVLPFVAKGRAPACPDPKRTTAVAALGWIWLLLPLVRVAWPRSNYYDGNRLFFEYAPALVLLAGMGLDLGLERLAALVGRWRERAGRHLPAVGLACIGLLAAWPVVQYHPYESTYYNLFVGGLGGAQKRQLTARACERMDFYCPDSESDYWAFSYRGAAERLNEVAAQGAGFYPCGNLMGPLTRFQPLRKDLRYVGREAAEFFVVIPRRPFCSEDDQRYVREHAEPVFEERRDGGLVVGLYRRKG